MEVDVMNHNENFERSVQKSIKSSQLESVLMPHYVVNIHYTCIVYLYMDGNTYVKFKV